MITVAGEALIDLIVDPAGHIDPRPGGALSTSCVVARLGLPAAFLGERWVGLTLDSVLEVPCRLAMPNEKQARRRGFCGRRSGLDCGRLLRARGFDLDIYTSFS